MATTRRQFLTGATATGFASAAWGEFSTTSSEVTPEMFGAKGDGRTNDTHAFAALSAHVNVHGGGTIILRPVTYIVGRQVQGGKGAMAFTPSDILHFVGCSGSIVVQGNGAILRTAPGLRYGAFDAESGKPLPDSRENLFGRRRASPYFGMIHVEKCSGSVEISNIELDGNLNSLQLGGKYGRAGWQAPGAGVRFDGNSGPARLSRIFSHHHPFDGIIFTDEPNRTTSTVVSDSIFEFNARTGGSITGGRNYSFESCRFRNTGKGGMISAPASGFDVEAEATTIRNISFSNCEFSNNERLALVAGGGDSEEISCDRCTFVGTTYWAIWPDRPRMRFRNCTVVGSIIHVHGDADPTRASQFVGCFFSDDPRLSPTGTVFIGQRPSRTIAVLTKAQNVAFGHCRFQLVGDAVLPQSTSDVIYSDCQMSQRSPLLSHPAGTYVGTTTISGNADLSGSIIRGIVDLNGRELAVD